MSSSVFALSVSPARTTLDFEPGLSREFSFFVSGGAEGARVSFSVAGDLKDYIVVPAGSFDLGSGRSFSYELNLPSDLEPGLHVGEIFVNQLPSEEVSGSQISASLSFVTQVYLYVPYEGKNAVARLYVYDAAAGENVSFVIPVINTGTEYLDFVGAEVEIYNGDLFVDNFSFESFNLLPGDGEEFVYDWFGFSVGEYVARAVVSYSDKEILLEESFRVGSEVLELLSVWSDRFVLGEINELDILVGNKWGADVSDVRVRAEILGEEDSWEVSSPAYDIEALGEETFPLFWDTSEVIFGEYDASIFVSYDDKEFMKSLKFVIDSDGLRILGLEYMQIPGKFDFEKYGLLIGLFVILILIIVRLVFVKFFLKNGRLF